MTLKTLRFLILITILGVVGCDSSGENSSENTPSPSEINITEVYIYEGDSLTAYLGTEILLTAITGGSSNISLAWQQLTGDTLPLEVRENQAIIPLTMDIPTGEYLIEVSARNSNTNDLISRDEILLNILPYMKPEVVKTIIGYPYGRDGHKILRESQTFSKNPVYVLLYTIGSARDATLLISSQGSPDTKISMEKDYSSSGVFAAELNLESGISEISLILSSSNEEDLIPLKTIEMGRFSIELLIPRTVSPLGEFHGALVIDSLDSNINIAKPSIELITTVSQVIEEETLFTGNKFVHPFTAIIPAPVSTDTLETINVKVNVDGENHLLSDEIEINSYFNTVRTEILSDGCDIPKTPSNGDIFLVIEKNNDINPDNSDIKITFNGKYINYTFVNFEGNYDCLSKLDSGSDIGLITIMNGYETLIDEDSENSLLLNIDIISDVNYYKSSAIILGSNL